MSGAIIIDQHFIFHIRKAKKDPIIPSINILDKFPIRFTFAKIVARERGLPQNFPNKQQAISSSMLMAGGGGDRSGRRGSVRSWAGHGVNSTPIPIRATFENSRSIFCLDTGR